MWLVFSDRFDHQNSVYESFFKLFGFIFHCAMFDGKEYENILDCQIILILFENFWKSGGFKTNFTKEDWNVVKIIWSACQDNEVGVVFWYL